VDAKHRAGAQAASLQGRARRSASPSVDPRRPLGRLGEDLAEDHLHGLGFSTLARNERCRDGEIDLIVFDGRTLVFAEVKTRRVAASGRGAHSEEQPLAGLRPRQLARLRRLAVGWLCDERRVRPTARNIRFDAIGVMVDASARPVRIDHVEGAW
jgi:putative endonuclease